MGPTFDKFIGKYVLAKVRNNMYPLVHTELDVPSTKRAGKYIAIYGKLISWNKSSVVFNPSVIFKLCEKSFGHTIFGNIPINDFTNYEKNYLWFLDKNESNYLLKKSLIEEMIEHNYPKGMILVTDLEHCYREKPDKAGNKIGYKKPKGIKIEDLFKQTP